VRSESVEAIYESGVFRPRKAVDLPEGKRVQLTVTAARTNAPDPAEDLSDLVVDTGIPDLAANIDHYLYGLPKQSGE